MLACFTKKRRYYRPGSHGLPNLAPALVLALAALLVGACAGSGGQQEETTGSATVDEILSDPNAFYGQEATVTGRVTEVITPLAFEINGERNEDTASSRYGEGADGLLVVKDTEEAPSPEVAVGQSVEVSGTVRSFDVGEVEEQIGEELVASLFTYWASQPSMVATEIEPAEGATP